MIALLMALQAAAPVQIDDVRRSREADRVFGQGILFRCDVPLNGSTLNWQAGLDGEITGSGKGPLTLVDAAAAPVTKFKPYRGSVSYDEKLPYGRRPLFLSLSSRQDIAGASYFAELRFTYKQDGTAPNRVNRASQVADAKITLYKAKDIVSSHGLHFPKEGARVAGTATCVASDRNPL